MYFEHKYFAQIDSTQAKAVELAQKQEAPEGLIVIADQQTAGRGRHAHTWESPSGLNLYVSIVLRPNWPLERCQEIQFMAGVATAETLHAFCKLSVHLKWPNDVVVKDRKIGGMILSSHAKDPKKVDFVVLGLGLNLNAKREDFSPALHEVATSAFIETGKLVERERFVTALLSQIAQDYDRLRCDGFEAVRQRWLHFAKAMVGQPIEIHQAVADSGVTLPSPLKGTVKGINGKGHLLVATSGNAQVAVVDGMLSAS